MDHFPALNGERISPNASVDHSGYRVDRQTRRHPAQSAIDSARRREHEQRMNLMISLPPSLTIYQTQRRVKRARSAPELSPLTSEKDHDKILDEHEQSAVNAFENAIAIANRRLLATKQHSQPDSGDCSHGSIENHAQSHPLRRVTLPESEGKTPSRSEEAGVSYATTGKAFMQNSASRGAKTQASHHQGKRAAKTSGIVQASSSQGIAHNKMTDSGVTASRTGDHPAVQRPEMDASELRHGLEPDRLIRLANSSLVKRGLDPGTTSTIVTGVVSAIVGAGGTAAGVATWWLAHKSRQRNKRERDIELQEIGNRLTEETDARRQLDRELRAQSEEIKRQQRDLNEQVKRQQRDLSDQIKHQQREVERRHVELDRRSRLLDRRADQLEPEAIEQRRQMLYEQDLAQNSRAKHLERWAARLEELETSVEERLKGVEREVQRLERTKLRNHYVKLVLAEMVATQRERRVNSKAKAWRDEFKSQRHAIETERSKLAEDRARFSRECQELADVEKLWRVQIEQLRIRSKDLARHEGAWKEELERSRDMIAAQQSKLETLQSQLEEVCKTPAAEGKTAEQLEQIGQPGEIGEIEELELLQLRVEGITHETQEPSEVLLAVPAIEQKPAVNNSSPETKQGAELRRRWANLHGQKGDT